MTYTNIRSYTFLCGRFDDFIIKPSISHSSMSHDIKFKMHVYLKQALSNTKVYMAYEIAEVVIIIGVAVLQVASLTKLLKGGSIV